MLASLSTYHAVQREAVEEAGVNQKAVHSSAPVERERRVGTLERRGRRWYARVTLPDGSRPRIPLGRGITEERAREKLAAYVERIRENKLVLRKRNPDGSVRLTVRELGEAWTKGDLYKKHGAVNKLRAKVSAKIDGWTLAKHVYGVKTRGCSRAR